MDIQEDKDFAALPEVAKLYQACKERDLTIAEREYLKGARDAWQAAKAQAVPECVWVGIYDGSVFESSCGHTFELSNDGTLDDNNMKHCCFCGGKIEAQEPAND